LSANVHDASVSSGSQRTTLEVGIATDPGRDPNKQVNEDSAFARETAHGYLAVVCDGMGGHVGGKEASSLAIETIFATFDHAPPTAMPPEVIGESIRQANRAIFEKGTNVPELKGMGSTCVAILAHPRGTEIAHVGDSRVYLMTQGQVYQVTKDHSLVQRLVDANMLTPEEASNHPSANQITNALGMRPDVEVEVRPQPLYPQPGDTFVLCSDGLSDEVGPQDILGILAPFPTCDVAARQLIDLANARGGHDNITVIVVRFPGGAALPNSAGVATPVAMPVAPVIQTAEMPILSAQQSTAPVHPQTVQNPVSAHPAPAPPPAYSPAPTPIEPPKKKGGGGIIIAILLVLVLLGAAAGLTIWYRSKQVVEPTTSPSTIEPETTTSAPASTKPRQIKVVVPEPEPSTSATEEPSTSASHPPKLGVPPKIPTSSDTVKEPEEPKPKPPPTTKPPPEFTK